MNLLYLNIRCYYVWNHMRWNWPIWLCCSHIVRANGLYLMRNRLISRNCVLFVNNFRNEDGKYSETIFKSRKFRSLELYRIVAISISWDKRTFTRNKFLCHFYFSFKNLKFIFYSLNGFGF